VASRSSSCLDFITDCELSSGLLLLSLRSMRERMTRARLAERAGRHQAIVRPTHRFPRCSNRFFRLPIRNALNYLHD
jgi:hypothetical protein